MWTYCTCIPTYLSTAYDWPRSTHQAGLSSVLVCVQGAAPLPSTARLAGQWADPSVVVLVWNAGFPRAMSTATGPGRAVCGNKKLKFTPINMYKACCWIIFGLSCVFVVFYIILFVPQYWPAGPLCGNMTLPLPAIDKPLSFCVVKINPLEIM